MILRTTNPFTRYNNDPVVSADQRSLLNQHRQSFEGQQFVDQTIVGGDNDLSTRFVADFLNNSFVYIVTETVGDYPYPYFTEKTWRGINTGVPFMMVNAQYSLAKLREFGFKTFSDWWNESYDTKSTVADRIEAMVAELEILAGLPVTDLEKIKREMLETVTHNQKHLKKFKDLDLENIAKSI